MGWIALTAVLALTVLVLGLSLLSLRRALREVAEELLGMMPTNVCFNEEIVGENV